MRVLDLCLALAGPTCGRLLHEFGAEVVKINKPRAGVGGYLNRGKRSLLLDLAHVESAAGLLEAGRARGRRARELLARHGRPPRHRLRGGAGTPAGHRLHLDQLLRPGGPMDAAGRGWERQGQAVTGIMERTGAVPAILGPYNLVDIGTGVLAHLRNGARACITVCERAGPARRRLAGCQTATYHQAPYMLDYAGHVSGRAARLRGAGHRTAQPLLPGCATAGSFSPSATKCVEARRR